MAKTRVKSIVPTDFAQNAKWFASDVDVDSGGRTPTLMVLYIHAVESVVIQVAYDGDAGTYVNLTPNPTADAVTKYIIPIKTADTLNFRTTDVGGINIRNGKIVSVFDDIA